MEQHLSKNTARAPNVHIRRIRHRRRLICQQQLWRSIPQRDHIRSVIVRLLDLRASQTEVRNFQHTIHTHQQVTRLQITMNDLVEVQRIQTFQKLLHEALDRLNTENRIPTQVHQAGKIMVQILKHQIDTTFVIRVHIPLRRSNNLLKHHNILSLGTISQRLQDLDLSNRSNRELEHAQTPTRTSIQHLSPHTTRGTVRQEVHREKRGATQRETRECKESSR